MWNFLPRDVGRIVCIMLGDVDMLGYLKVISKEWVIYGDEQIYQEVATRIYLSQTDKKLLNVHKWGSWLDMLIRRPRLRTNGFYSLRTSYWKPPCNDAFWEEKKVEYTEVKFFRHFRFFNDGTCLYAMNNVPPRDMRLQLEAEKLIHKKLFEGRYLVHHGDVVTVDIDTHYCHIRFRLHIQHLCGSEEGGYDCDYAGNHNSLKITEHSTVPLLRGNNIAHDEEDEGAPVVVDENNRVIHALPQYANLQFHREWLFHERRKELPVLTPA